MRVLVTGAEGQLGRALVARLGSRVAWSGGRAGLDVCDAAAVRRLVSEQRPDVVVNAAAYNRVDAAESEVAAAYAVNAFGALHLARACCETGALLVHVSTDYVFDGSATRPYREQDATRPLNVYGASKLAGEQLVAQSGAQHLVVRTSGVLGQGGSRGKGGSFVERILARAASGEPLRVVADQVFSPTTAPDLAQLVLALVAARARGIWHAANAGQCSWYELALAALEAAGRSARVEAIRTQDVGQAARRPAYSVLDCGRLETIGQRPRPWREALAELLAA